MYLENSIVDENAANVRFWTMCPIEHPKSARSEFPGISEKSDLFRQAQTWERCKMDIQHESREDREQAMRNISVDLAEIAETDLNLPFSLMKDAWGICFQSGNTTPMVQEWAYALVQAIRAYRENPEGYRQSTVLWGKEIEKPLI